MSCVQLIGHSSPVTDNLFVLLGDQFDRVERATPASVEATLDAVQLHRPSWLIYSGATAASSWEPMPCEREESQVVCELARCCGAIGAQFTVISSDAAFIGPKLFHDESEAPAADAWSQWMQAVEQAALAGNPSHQPLVVRTHAFGWSAGGASFAERIWSALSCGEPAEVDAASYATPLLASDLARLLMRCYRGKLQGLVHIAGAERTSEFRFAQELAAIAGFDRRLVRPTRNAGAIDGGGGVAPTCQPLVSRETSLGSRLVRRELGVALPLLRDGLARFVEQATDGHRERIRAGSPTAFARAA